MSQNDAHLPLVSVCLPTIGRMEYLERALGSLAEQTYPRLEILLLDNATPPEARDLLEGFAARRSGSRILRVEERVPMFANFNRGIGAASGKYLVFFHDDDIYHPTFVQRYVEVMEGRPRAGFAGGNFELIDASGDVVRRQRLIRETGVWSGRQFIEDLMRRGRCALPTPGLVFRREALMPEGFDPSLPINWGDFTVLMRIAERWDVAVLADPLYAWRVHGQNGSNVPFSEAIPLRSRVLRDFCAEYLGRHPDERSFVDRLSRMVDRHDTNGLLWGWVSASEETDAIACRKMLGTVRKPLPLSFALGLLERGGLSLRRRRAMMPLVRRLAQALHR